MYLGGRCWFFLGVFFAEVLGKFFLGGFGFGCGVYFVVWFGLGVLFVEVLLWLLVVLVHRFLWQLKGLIFFSLSFD